VQDALCAVLSREGITRAVGRAEAVAPSETEGGGIILTVTWGNSGGNSTRVECDAVLIAAGRTPTVQGLGLDAAGVAYSDRRGITVDAYGQTSIPHIFAAGDCVGGPQFTHYAGYQATMAARNILFPGEGEAAPKVNPAAATLHPLTPYLLLPR
jgi:pyruvate/2-oxoglutarate dehydrogenase complex dihydrolipoamide dehydrogenase (E3) component